MLYVWPELSPRAHHTPPETHITDNIPVYFHTRFFHNNIFMVHSYVKFQRHIQL